MSIKKILAIAVTICFLAMGTIIPAHAENKNSELKKTYDRLTEFSKKNKLPIDISYETFEKEYYENDYFDTSEYLEIYQHVLNRVPQRKGLPILYATEGNKWYYNTGTTLLHKPNYRKYNLLRKVKKGDIIFEAKGGFGIGAHIAIVEGIYWNNKYKTNYIRLVEAIEEGVVRSILDDERADDKGVTILRPMINQYKINNAVNFCVSQLGKPYRLDFKKDTSPNQPNWYCSELVWAAFKNQGVDIETQGFYNEPGITPRDIRNGNYMRVVGYY